MDKFQNIELSNLNHNKQILQKTDSDEPEVVLRRSKNSDIGSADGSSGKRVSDGVTFKKGFTTQSHGSQDTEHFEGGIDQEEFESIFNGQKRDSEELRAWDRFKTLPPPDDDETLDGEWFGILIKLLKIFAYFLTFVLTLGFAVLSKSIILLMTSMIRVNRTIPICNENLYDVYPPLDTDKRYSVIYRDNDPERVAWIWTLFFAVITPDLFTLGRSARICYFKTYKIPTFHTFITVFTAETCQAIGISILLFLILPTIDVIKGAMMTNALCLVPGILLILSNHDKKNLLNKWLTIVATILQLIGFIIWPLVASDEDSSTKFWYLPIALFLVSFTWWENFVDPSSDYRIVKWLLNVKKDLAKTRYFTYIIVSIWKMILIFALMILIEYLSDGTQAVESTFSKFTSGFTNRNITLIRDKRNLEYQSSIEGDIHTMFIGDPYIKVWILLIHIGATYMCYAIAKFSCKICIQGFSFAIPVNLAVPITVSFLWAMVSASAEDKCEVCSLLNSFQYIFWYTPEVDAFSYNSNAFNYASTFMWVLSLSSQIWIAIHVWFSTSERLASTEKLFIIPMYSSVIIDQSLAFNRRRLNFADDIIKDEEAVLEEKLVNKESNDKSINHLYESVNEPMPVVKYSADSDETVTIFVCATLWHENKEEVIQMLKAVMRLDADQCARRQAQQFFNIHPSLTDYYEIEFNIFFDDAFDQGESLDEDDRLVNRFVKQLIEIMDEAASHVHETLIVLDRPNVVPTPYGGKLEWTLPGQNRLIAHLKDKTLIRHRKRWSQCMYMYYLLGHRIAERQIDERRKETIAMNTFILALDGDINFRPHALHLVVDLMKKNKKLGAACGRIHPIGSGPIVWYQKFEYAIGHWLQKATEHVFGCVLCSPGCFSLFRARAVMDDSVMNKYTTKPSEALHYVQYDQGEDRWLCTLLLQQGWRIEYCAASDSYTHAPEGFGEFYIQRRRWAPSTMANIMDLLGAYKRTIACNTDISMPYIIYQAMLMVGTVLSPGTIFLMCVGALNTVMGLTSEISLICNIVPILSFSIVCLVVKKNDTIIFMAMILSTLYALLMLAVLVGTGIEIADKGWLTPNSMFFMGMMGSFLVAAIIHPQEFACVIPLLLYMLLIPSMYLLLTIYSVTNMHIVTWGTREVKSKLTAKEAAAAAEAAKEAEAAKAKKKNLLGFLDVSQYGSKAGLFTCMCCSNSKSEEESAKLSEIKEQLFRVNENVNTIKQNVVTAEPTGRRNTIYRRSSSSAKHDRNEILSTIMGGQTDEEEGMESDYDERSAANEETGPRSPSMSDASLASKPKWCHDKTFKKFPIVPLTPNELDFWKEFIPKYLLPLDEDAREQARIASDLKDLRSKMVFAFGIMNTIFILFVFLLQMHQDVFSIPIPTGIDHYNKTYIEDEDRYEETPIYSYVQMEPISLVLVVFFGSILVIQLIGMFMHRFGTLAHLLAFTTIDFCSNQKEPDDEESLLNKNAVKITKQLQKLKGIDNDEKEVISNSNLPNNRKSIYPSKAPKQLNLDDAFRQRIMSLRPDSIDPTQKSLLKRQSTVQAIRRRRDTIMAEERLSIVGSDQNDLSVGSNTRPLSWMTGPRSSIDMNTKNQSLRGFSYLHKNK